MDWAMSNASPAAVERYQNYGKQLVFGEDITKGSGVTWVFSPATFTDNDDKTKTVMQSTTLMTADNFMIKKFADANYCKGLSPARALEWIYIDGLRDHDNYRKTAQSVVVDSETPETFALF